MCNCRQRLKFLSWQGSAYLLASSNGYASSRYGAIWFSHFQDSIMDDGRFYSETAVSQCRFIARSLNYSTRCSSFGGVGYVIQYNFTALHSALLYETLANEALVRHATNISDFVVQATIAPLPLTFVESREGAFENALLVWFLVSIQSFCK